MNKRILIILLIFLGLIALAAGIWAKMRWENNGWILLSPLGKIEQEKEKPLAKYELERLKDREAQPSQIVWDKEINKGTRFTSYIFSYKSEGKKISGLANVPAGNGPFPVIIMLRGWVDPGVYETGVGTQRAGEVLADNGYLTLAPDFLGYGESDMPPNDVWEERFLKNISILDLLASIGPSTSLRADSNRVGIWAHSNGGLSALTILELTGKNYPTTLWAPVSQFFPYDVLYYIFEADDKGKALRKSLAEFEKDYDTEKYSYDNYLSWIKAPIQLHQGFADPYIPVSWSDQLVEKLKGLENEVYYFKYVSAGHHMEGSWDLVVQRDLEFFKKELGKN